METDTPVTVYRAVDVAGMEVAADTGSFTGYAMTWAYDKDGVRFEQGSLARSIKDRAGKIPVMIVHARDGGTVMETVGFLAELTEDHVGLMVRGGFLSTDLGQAARAQAVADGIKFMSIGAKPLRYERAGRVLVVHEAKLLEVTLTNIPADPDAEILTVRTEDAAGTPAPPPPEPPVRTDTPEAAAGTPAPPPPEPPVRTDTPEAAADRSRRMTLLTLEQNQ